MKKTIIIFLSLFLCEVLISQDIHFSQIYNDIIYENPSYTGNHNGLGKVHLINKDQWRSVSVPYKTFYFGFDKKLPLISGAFGLNFFQDKAGDLNLNNNHFNLTYSHLFKINNSKIFFGISSGLGQLKIDYSNLSVIDYEVFSISRINYLDLSLGATYTNYLNNNIYLENSFSASHINTPSISLSDNSNTNLSVKYIFNTKMTYYLLYDNITSVFKIVNQGPFNKIEVGSLYSFNHSSGYSVYPGLWYRNKDALIFSCGVKSKNYAIDFSYDLNISKLSNASNYKGGFEVSIMYLFINKNIVELKDFICPDYL